MQASNCGGTLCPTFSLRFYAVFTQDYSLLFFTIVLNSQVWPVKSRVCPQGWWPRWFNPCRSFRKWLCPREASLLLLPCLSTKLEINSMAYEILRFHCSLYYVLFSFCLNHKCAQAPRRKVLQRRHDRTMNRNVATVCSLSGERIYPHQVVSDLKFNPFISHVSFLIFRTIWRKGRNWSNLRRNEFNKLVRCRNYQKKKKTKRKNLFGVHKPLGHRQSSVKIKIKTLQPL